MEKAPQHAPNARSGLVLVRAGLLCLRLSSLFLVNAYLAHHHLPPALRDEAFKKALKAPCYHQERNAQAKKSHTKTRIQFYRDLAIDVDKIKSCIT